MEAGAYLRKRRHGMAAGCAPGGFARFVCQCRCGMGVSVVCALWHASPHTCINGFVAEGCAGRRTRICACAGMLWPRGAHLVGLHDFVFRCRCWRGWSAWCARGSMHARMRAFMVRGCAMATGCAPGGFARLCVPKQVRDGGRWSGDAHLRGAPRTMIWMHRSRVPPDQAQSASQAGLCARGWFYRVLAANRYV